MPSEITLTENARVCCRAKVVRVTPVEQKFGVAARLEGYEYLPKAETAAQVSANFPRISSSAWSTVNGAKPALGKFCSRRFGPLAVERRQPERL